jgi:hypothetical protein
MSFPSVCVWSFFLNGGKIERVSRSLICVSSVCMTSRMRLDRAQPLGLKARSDFKGCVRMSDSQARIRPRPGLPCVMSVELSAIASEPLG